jgi:hypothetical protein
MLSVVVEAPNSVATSEVAIAQATLFPETEEQLTEASLRETDLR